MAESFIQLPPDSTGKKLATRTDASGSHQEVHVLADANGVLLDPATLAKSTDVGAVSTALGTDTGTPPSGGAGVRGWLRGIYDRLGSTLNVNTGLAPLTDTQLRAAVVPVLDAKGLVPKVFDAVTYTATSSTVETYRYYTGGTAGSLVATVTVTYTDATKTVLTSVVRT